MVLWSPASIKPNQVIIKVQSATRNGLEYFVYTRLDNKEAFVSGEDCSGHDISEFVISKNAKYAIFDIIQATPPITVIINKYIHKKNVLYYNLDKVLEPMDGSG